MTTNSEHIIELDNKGMKEIECTVCNEDLTLARYWYDLDYQDIFCSSECLVNTFPEIKKYNSI